MLPAGLVVAALAVPALAFAFPDHSAARAVLATSVFYWSLLLLLGAWMAKVNYALLTRVEGSRLHIVTVGGRRTVDLAMLDRIRSFSMWGQYGGAHALRLHTRDGQRAMVVADMALAAMNRKNLEREREVRAALVPHADVADPRARWWLGAGPRPPRLGSARHIMAMVLLFVMACLALLVGLVAYLAVVLD